MKFKYIVLVASVVLLAACTPKTAPVAEDVMEKKDDVSTTEKSDVMEKKEVVVPENEELDDVVEGLEDELDKLDIDATYEEVDSEDLGY